MTMRNQTEASPQGHRGVRSFRSRALIAGTAVAGVAIMGIGTVAATGTTPAVSRDAVQARESIDPCGFQIDLVIGDAARVAADDMSGDATETVVHGHVEIALVLDGESASVGAMIDDAAHVRITAAQDRATELIEFVKDAIDHPDSSFDDAAEIVVDFSGTHCDLATALEGDISFHDVLDGDAVIAFETDEGDCQLSSLFGPDGFDLADVDDFEFELTSNDGGFAIGINTGDGELALDCSYDE